MSTTPSAPLKPLNTQAIAAWANIILWFNRTLDLIDEQKKEADSLLVDLGRQKRFARLLKGYSIERWFELSDAASLTLAVAIIAPLSGAQGIFDRLSLGKILARIGLWNVQNEDGKKDIVLAPRLGTSVWRFMDAQLRSVLVFQQTAGALLRTGSMGEDEAYFRAVRVDPSVLACAPLAGRLQIAVASQDRVFLRRIASSLENPVDIAALEFPRLRTAMWLMHRAKALERLNQASAYELFVVRTRLYPALGMADSSASLWRFLKRRITEMDKTSRRKVVA